MRSLRRPLLLALLLLAVVALSAVGPSSAGASAGQPAAAAAAPGQPAEAGAGHSGPIAPVLLGLVVILTGAKLGGWAAERLKQPAVLGELAVGVLLGNLPLIGFDGLQMLKSDVGIQILAELGVVLLLFAVGLESNVGDMMSVGKSSFLVACAGVVVPMLLGWGVSAWWVPGEEGLAHLFVGATLCATSVGITARVLSDLGKVKTREAKIVLGAAVIDDVLGLVVLAVVTGTIQAANAGTSLDTMAVGAIVVKAALFLVGSLILGSWLSPRLFRLASLLQVKGALLVASLVFCFALAWIADAIELAPIVGAFAAGLILDEVHYRDLVDRGEHHLEEALKPITAFLVPVFFVRMGLEVDLRSFASGEVLAFAALLTVAAVIGKLVCGLGVVERGVDRLAVSVGMIPRGEVGLIFAGIGATLLLHGKRVISPAVYGAVVIMVIVTTLVTPPLLEWALTRAERRRTS